MREAERLQESHGLKGLGLRGFGFRTFDVERDFMDYAFRDSMI